MPIENLLNIHTLLEEESHSAEDIKKKETFVVERKSIL